jgi:hypothetical protein
MNQWLLWVIGLTSCIGGVISLYVGLRAERNRSLVIGCAAFIVFWYAGFFCFVGAS